MEEVVKVAGERVEVDPSCNEEKCFGFGEVAELDMQKRKMFFFI